MYSVAVDILLHVQSDIVADRQGHGNVPSASLKKKKLKK
jgi:hypothetical protein